MKNSLNSLLWSLFYSLLKLNIVNWAWRFFNTFFFRIAIRWKNSFKEFQILTQQAFNVLLSNETKNGYQAVACEKLCTRNYECFYWPPLAWILGHLMITVLYHVSKTLNQTRNNATNDKRQRDNYIRVDDTDQFTVILYRLMYKFE